MSCRSLTINGVIQLGTAALMVGASVLAQVGAKFFSMSVLPSAAQLGSEFAATLSTGALPLVGCALVALGVDVLVGNFLKKIMPDYEQTAYLLKRVFTAAVVIGFTFIGVSPIAALATFAVLIVRDIIYTAIQERKNQFEEPLQNYLTKLGVDLKSDEGDLNQQHSNELFDQCPAQYKPQMDKLVEGYKVRIEFKKNALQLGGDDQLIKNILEGQKNQTPPNNKENSN